MPKRNLLIIFLSTLSILFFIRYASIADTSPESSSATASPESSAVTASTEVSAPFSVEASAAPSEEAAPAITLEVSASPESSVSPEAAVSPEASAPSPKEDTSVPPPGLIPSPKSEKATEKPLEEGTSYKGVAWGAEFSKFKEIKGFSGNLGQCSAAFVGSADDNDIALLLGIPASIKSSRGEQRIMFEFAPQKFASIYFAPDDVYYIFYDGKLAMVFSRVIDSNFATYRDNFYKKYKRTGGISALFDPSADKKYKLEAIIFEKGETKAYLIRTQSIEKKKSVSSAKILFVSKDIFNSIRNEIKEKIINEKQSKGEIQPKDLEKDLKKIE